MLFWWITCLKVSMPGADIGIGSGSASENRLLIFCQTQCLSFGIGDAGSGA